ncbi:DEAD/DEAH box helicase [Zhongshania sp. BJYM1]|uniref:DEAD/DEAH box helicase n=1 Tax=Zhongshania aquatica TaxID=2965069 RepID=UPI0022B3B386|nr:DEAD/DEAH box helicase [Marortus sp. BJYM1]
MPSDTAAAAETMTFDDLGLAPMVLAAVKAVGYETPSPIQAATIPFILAGRDLVGQAQTGTGKTAAFALPLLSRLDVNSRRTQALILAPTRELAIQVAEALQSYASHMPGFQVLPIYGGQDYRGQLAALKRGVQVVVGTPGRVMDHMRRGTLKLDDLSHLVLDEADEMLRMGFIDDVEWIMSQMPEKRQIALFSATMPPAIRRIATTYLNNPEQVTIQTKTSTAITIRQRYWMARGLNKLDALTRILEAEPFDGMIIFVRTKLVTTELAEKLQARGYTAAALNGDIAQAQRERTVEHLKNGRLDIVIATDVAARGLDVERISHVINYDIPHDTEAYVHRIGRTGRAGRTGDAILFVAPREKRMLQAIERATRQSIEEMGLPTAENINALRVDRFMQKITDTLAGTDLSFYRKMLQEYIAKHDVSELDVAAALACQVQGDKPLLVKDAPKLMTEARSRDKPSVGGKRIAESSLQRYRLEVGRQHGVSAGNIVGAIANEANIDSANIGRISIYPEFSTVDLPADLPEGAMECLKTTRVAGQALNISVHEGGDMPIERERPRKPRISKTGDKGGRKPVTRVKAKSTTKPTSPREKRGKL